MRRIAAISFYLSVLCLPTTVMAQNVPGITDSEILIGQTSSYSGPAQIYSVVSKTEIAYFNMINDQGGINGRKVKVLSLDDGYVPAKTLEH